MGSGIEMRYPGIKHYTEFNEDTRFNLDEFDRNRSFCNDIFTFDTENSTVFLDDTGNWVGYNSNMTTEWISKHKRRSLTYIWMLSINNQVYYGRYLEEFKPFLMKVYNLIKGRSSKGDRHIQIWVHNLPYDFQFLRNIFTFDREFARRKGKPFNAFIKDTNIQFRCSAVLSGMSLEKTAKQYNLPIEKLEGNLDYNVYRNPETELTTDELEYCKNDCLVVYEFIKKMKTIYGEPKDYRRFPLTSTSTVRLGFKEYLRDNNVNFGVSNWHNKMKMLKPDLETYKILKESLQGGYVFTNGRWENQTLYDVNSIDKKSAYPAVMLTEKFPTTVFVKNTKEEFKNMIKSGTVFDDKYCRIFKVRFENLRLKCDCNIYPIAFHKASKKEGYKVFNNKIVECDTIEMTITDVDLEIISKCYDWDKRNVIACYSALGKLLPKEFRQYIASLFIKKEEIGSLYKQAIYEFGENDQRTKDLKVSYDLSKSKLNSLFGMCVTDTIGDDTVSIEDNKWEVNKITDEEIQCRLDSMKNQLTSSLWGPFITAYCRRNLIEVALQFGREFIYCDTDSIKYNIDIDSSFIDVFNSNMKNKVLECSSDLNIDSNKLIGLGEFRPDGFYKEFRVLGNKKYSYRTKDGALCITVAGLNKNEGVDSLGNDISNFNPTLVVDTEHSGLKVVEYQDEQIPMVFLKKDLSTYTDNSKYGITMFPSDFNFDDRVDRMKYKRKVDKQ